ncbi:uncharacterized protein LOC115636428 isoform X1 [Gopherus evgoodei]|uniref:uncharacterized protein LOC115636428 isoform X1 n=1 Tax=Gopherus evgoodei TaxID=1825980 RepID=UPI0011CF6451|nr:uncharacterized protein LOC115636428 isoform X1 [Gopherus evgoodei]
MPTAEHPYELAMYLHFLHQNLFPSWTEIFAMAEWMMSLLEREDTEFFTHLQQCFRKNCAVDLKDFLVELIVREREKAQELYSATDRSEQNKHLTKELLASPVFSSESGWVKPLADLSPRLSSMEAGKVSLGFQDLLQVEVKDVLLKLVLPVPQVEISHIETWLKEFDPLAVELTVSVFYGLEKLCSKTSSFKLSLLQKTKGKTAKKK